MYSAKILIGLSLLILIEQRLDLLDLGLEFRNFCTKPLLHLDFLVQGRANLIGFIVSIAYLSSFLFIDIFFFGVFICFFIRTMQISLLGTDDSTRVTIFKVPGTRFRKDRILVRKYQLGLLPLCDAFSDPLLATLAKGVAHARHDHVSLRPLGIV